MMYWIRNDLRVHDNPALIQALQQGCTEAVFLSCEKQWQQHHQSPVKTDFIYRHLQLLSKQLADLGVRFRIIEVDDFQGQAHWLKAWQDGQHSKGLTAQVFANAELELNERLRDKQIIDSGVSLNLFEADVIISKGLVLTAGGDMYRVFTPFKRAWITHLLNNGFECLPKPNPIKGEAPNVNNNDVIDSIEQRRKSINKSSEHWPDASEVLSGPLREWLDNGIHDYGNARDFPAKPATSRLSPHLCIGAISPRLLIRLLMQSYPMILEHQQSSTFVWLNELIWREFYRHLLHAYPNLIKGENFNRQYDTLQWRNDPQEFARWCQGKTGYPIVDAAMRQLNQTGWMHNRLRMIVASFLTKDLLIDWRWGEQYFMEQLIDGDFAANNGGWQWAASTGCDAQPYFRIFNPVRQSQNFDPNGEFIRKYVPELAQIPDRDIHFPHQYLTDNNCENLYESAIVDHKQAREVTLAAYKACR
ncbi:deoxyribodipyrimidine photo-lyase [Thalassotalea sp. PS06]|uniref:deoxyribodipyrimidine photo-lyase n=1 Tax=Thalassotalea sp. PS06 TaxID=2594005 RepID=UPI00116288E1|nr:deoxyribodipyrimidine photo-lyase [Thalassotalea sp. PS06]QDP02141.1 deoxyribodipyrimidine photo-lyase [Thalassotalea sp. PS06]